MTGCIFGRIGRYKQSRTCMIIYLNQELEAKHKSQIKFIQKTLFRRSICFYRIPTFPFLSRAYENFEESGLTSISAGFFM